MSKQIFHLPDLGEGLTEATLIEWMVAVGDTVAVDQTIAEVETKKSIVELPSPFAGVITALHGEAGGTIETGAPILEVEPELNAEATLVKPDSDTAELDKYREEERAGSGNVLIGYGTGAGPVKGRRRRNKTATSDGGSTETTSTPAASLAHSPVHSSTQASAQTSASAPASASASAPTSASTSAPASASASAPASQQKVLGPVAVRSPIVRRLAKDLGVDLRFVTPTGANGVITRNDILVTVGNGSSGSIQAAPLNGDLPVLRTEPFTPLRKAVSAKLTQSRAEIPEATVWVDVDLTELWQMRHKMAPVDGKAPSLTTVFAKFALLALKEYPLMASRITPEGDALIIFDGVNLGIAVDTPRGLMVPKVSRAHELSIAVLDAQIRELGTQARSGRIAPDKLSGSTFTLNNYGALGVDGSAAIINHPEVAILGMGRVLEKPWVVNGEIVPRRIAQLSLVFDHRVCDGGYASGFLRAVVDLLEQPLTAYSHI